jgi:two-component system, chemotaxis family, sensor kinase Cph1
MEEMDNRLKDKHAELRKRAEEILAQQESSNEDILKTTDIQHLLHELNIYQTELEMQNDELRSVQQKLEETLERYTDLYDYAPVGYFKLDSNGVILNVNLTGSKMLKIVRSALINKPFSSLVVNKDRNDLREYINRIQETNADQNLIKIEMLRQDGSTFFAQMESTIVKMHNNGAIQIRTILQDISARKILEDKLISINKELSEFTYRVSHDLKSPIQLILAYIEEIEQNPEKISEYISNIKSQTESLSDFIEKLLNLSRAGRIIGNKEIVPIETIINYLVAMLPVKDIPYLDINPKLDVKEIYGDLESLTVIFSNLLENAVKYRDPQKDKMVLTISSYRKDDQIVISIKDNCIGIEEKDIVQIFQPGFTVSRKKGTGFGLAIARKIVEAHNGTITAKSAGKNKGTEFIITLPEY